MPLFLSALFSFVCGCSTWFERREEPFLEDTLNKVEVTVSQEGPSTQYALGLYRKRMEYRERSLASPDGKLVTRFYPVKAGKGNLVKQLVTDNLQANKSIPTGEIQVASYEKYDWFYEYTTSTEAGADSAPQQAYAMDLLQVTGPPASIAYVDKLIEEAEYRPQVVLDVAVLETSWTGAFDLGTQWTYSHDGKGLFKQFQQDLRLSPEGGEFTGMPTATFSTVHNGWSVQAVIEALSQDQKVHVLSRPTLMVMSGFRAAVVTGQKVPVVSYLPQGNNTVIVQTEFQSVGVHLHVLPTVFKDRIRLDILPEVSEVVGFTDPPALSPIIDHSYVNTSVEVKTGDVLILAGLYQKDLETRLKGIPGLKEIPYLKYLYSQEGADGEYSNVVFILKPRVVYSLEDVDEHAEGGKPAEAPVQDESNQPFGPPRPSDDPK